MNETLLNNLRALADSTKHRLPEGWKSELNNCNEPYFHSRGSNGYATTWAVPSLPVESILDLLFRLARAIEGKGDIVFGRGQLGGGDWLVDDGNGLWECRCFDYGNAESEAEALLQCIFAATKVAADV